MSLNEETSNNNKNDSNNVINDYDFSHQINLAINESKKINFLLTEEEQIKIAIQESLEEMKLNSRKLLKKKRIIFDNDEEEDEKSNFINEKHIEKEYPKFNGFIENYKNDREKIINNNNESEEQRKDSEFEKDKKKEMNTYQ